MSYDFVTKDFLVSHNFTADEGFDEHYEQSFKLYPNRDKLPPNDEYLNIELRKKFSYFFGKKFKCSYGNVETYCQIKSDTFRKYLNGKRTINIYVVAKFCIGAKLSIEETYELFKLCNHILAPNDYLLDAIIIDAIKCKDDIEEFYSTCRRCKLSKKILDKLSYIV